jgi:hypothetical protein
MYSAFVQMPLALHEDKTEIVEAKIELADEYIPMEGQWMFHDLFKGLMPLGPVVYDAKRNAVVLTTRGTTYDFTMTLDEWLSTRPQWKKAEHAFIKVDKDDENYNEDF